MYLDSLDMSFLAKQYAQRVGVISYIRLCVTQVCDCTKAMLCRENLRPTITLGLLARLTCKRTSLLPPIILQLKRRSYSTLYAGVSIN